MNSGINRALLYQIAALHAGLPFVPVCQ